MSHPSRRPFPALVVLIAALAGVVMPSRMSAGAAAETWTFAASDHFEVYTTGGERRARSVLAYFERVHAFFEDFLKLSPKQQVPTRVIVFSNTREYTPYRLNEVAAAYYRSGPDRDYIVMGSFDEESFPLVVHEYAHLIMRHSGMIYPRWLNEGMAEFFSTITPEGGRMSLGRVPRGRLYELVNGGPMMDMARLLAIDGNSPEYNSRNHAGMFYAQSWALTHMIMTADGYRQGRSAFLSAIERGAAADDAFQAIYGKDLRTVGGDLQIYARNERFLYFTTGYREPKQVTQFPTRVVDAFEAGLTTANLLASGSPTQQEAARAAYERLATERPDELPLVEARAIFEIRSGNNDAARPLIMRAVEQQSSNPAIYRWASILSSNTGDRALMLEKAVGLNPGDIDMRLMYADSLLRAQNPAGALDALQPITRLEPEQTFNFMQMMANIRLQLGDGQTAREAAGLARQHARAGGQAEYADQLIARADAFLARSSGSTPPAGGTSASAAETTPARVPDAPRTGPVASALQRSLTIVTGQIRRVTCDTQPPVVELVTDAGVLLLAIDDPLAIKVQGAGAATVDIECGPQQTRVRLGYDASAKSATVAGVVRLLDFQ